MQKTTLMSALIAGATLVSTVFAQPANADDRDRYLNDLAHQTLLNQRLSAQAATEYQQQLYYQGELNKQYLQQYNNQGRGLGLGRRVTSVPYGSSYMNGRSYYTQRQIRRGHRHGRVNSPYFAGRNQRRWY